MPKIWYVLVCRECWPEAMHSNLVGDMPFNSPEERGRWAAEHTAGTGHNSWIVIDG